LALDLIDSGMSGRLVSVQNGRYCNVPIETISGAKKVVDVAKYYDQDRLRPRFKSFSDLPLFLMTSDAQSV
jgi:6-phosphofructokinase 1